MASIQTLPDLVDPKFRSNNKKRMPVKSKAQAGLMGAVIAGKKKLPGMTKEKAKEHMRGVKVKKLPKYVESGKTPRMRRKKLPTSSRMGY